MKTITIKLFKFSELSESAQLKAINSHTLNSDHILEAAIATTKEFCKAFEIDWSLSRSPDGFQPADNYDVFYSLSGFRLRTYIINNFSNILYKGRLYAGLVGVNKSWRPIKRTSKVFFEKNYNLTGTGFDVDILGPIFDFISNTNNSTNLADIFCNCFENLNRSVSCEIEQLNSRESIRDDLFQQDHFDFLEDGTLYN